MRRRVLRKHHVSTMPILLPLRYVAQERSMGIVAPPPVAKISSKPDQIWPISARLLFQAKLGRSRPNLLHIRSNSAPSWAMSGNSSGLRSKLPQIWVTLPEAWPTWAKFDRFRPDIGRKRPKSGQIRLIPDQTCPSSAKCVPDLVKLRSHTPHSAEVGRCRTRLTRVGQNSARSPRVDTAFVPEFLWTNAASCCAFPSPFAEECVAARPTQ